MKDSHTYLEEMMKIFIDTCSLVDYFFSRDNGEMKRILLSDSDVRFYVSSLTIANFAYLARKKLKVDGLKKEFSKFFK